MANPRRRRIKKLSERAAVVAREAGNKEALEAALAIAYGCHQVKEAEEALARVEALCAAKEQVEPEPEVKPKPKAKSKAKSVASKVKKALSKDK